MESHEDSTNGGFNHFSFFLRTLPEQSEEKLEESPEIARDVIIAARTYVSPLKGKRWVIHNWGLVRTYVGILRELNWDLFWGVY